MKKKGKFLDLVVIILATTVSTVFTTMMNEREIEEKVNEALADKKES